jgi:hypothetical protein
VKWSVVFQLCQHGTLWKKVETIYHVFPYLFHFFVWISIDLEGNLLGNRGKPFYLLQVLYSMIDSFVLVQGLQFSKGGLGDFITRMDISQFELHARIEDIHWWFRGRRELIFDQLKKHVPQGEGKVIAEIGCGTGGSFMTVATIKELMNPWINTAILKEKI